MDLVFSISHQGKGEPLSSGKVIISENLGKVVAEEIELPWQPKEASLPANPPLDLGIHPLLPRYLLLLCLSLIHVGIL
jgi:hypothetical protein